MRWGYSPFQRFAIREMCLSQQEFKMTSIAQAIHPFSLMMEPELVLKAMAHSQQLRGLHKRTLRPLDKPLIPYTSEALASRAAFDAAIDAQDWDDRRDYLLN
jgi:hypothetical protein